MGSFFLLLLFCFLEICYLTFINGEGNGTPLQYTCLENPMDGGAWRLQSMGSLRVGHDWATSRSLFTFMDWRRKWQPTPVFLPGESQGPGSPVGCCLWGHTESDTTEVTLQQQQHNRSYLFGGKKVLKIVMFFLKVTFNTFQTNPIPIRAHLKHNIQNVQARFFFV